MALGRIILRDSEKGRATALMAAEQARQGNPLLCEIIEESLSEYIRREQPEFEAEEASRIHENMARVVRVMPASWALRLVNGLVQNDQWNEFLAESDELFAALHEKAIEAAAPLNAAQTAPEERREVFVEAIFPAKRKIRI